MFHFMAILIKMFHKSTGIPPAQWVAGGWYWLPPVLPPHFHQRVLLLGQELPLGWLLGWGLQERLWRQEWTPIPLCRYRLEVLRVVQCGAKTSKFIFIPNLLEVVDEIWGNVSWVLQLELLGDNFSVPGNNHRFVHLRCVEGLALRY